MDTELQKKLADCVFSFVRDSHIKMNQFNIEDSQLRIAFPEYLKGLFLSGMYELSPSPTLSPDTFLGIKVHPTWENAITLYYIDYPQVARADIPIFKLSFSTVSEDYGLDRKVILDVAEAFRYKI